MFDLIDEDLFAETVASHFEVLDEQYVRDMCVDLLSELRDTFDGAYETRFVIVETDTGKPMKLNSVLTKREAAEEFLKIVGDDKYSVALLLTER